LKAAELRKLRERDKWCWHCGDENDLVPHHRINRGMGGSKALDNLQNVILVCASYNGMMESDSRTATLARELGHKVSKFSNSDVPVFDNIMQTWYLLDVTGGKLVTEPPQ
tara:strand:- start:494 stop:823 length:330 start_codon:yes stop_codon:yes gene_type:complete